MDHLQLTCVVLLPGPVAMGDMERRLRSLFMQNDYVSAADLRVKAQPITDANLPSVATGWATPRVSSLFTTPMRSTTLLGRVGGLASSGHARDRGKTTLPRQRLPQLRPCLLLLQPRCRRRPTPPASPPWWRTCRRLISAPWRPQFRSSTPHSRPPSSPPWTRRGFLRWRKRTCYCWRQRCRSWTTSPVAWTTCLSGSGLRRRTRGFGHTHMGRAFS